MNAPARKFTAALAVREQVPLLIGLMGPSGGGKTFSALRLATGIQKVSGGEIYMIDTEARRGLHYADKFNFKHVPFGAPFGSLDYLEALRFCAKEGAGVVIVDSMSHEHEGPGGLIDFQEQELTRMAGDNHGRREAMKMRAWGKPKAARRALINGLLQMNCNFIFCFRAKNSVKPVKVPQPNGPPKTEVVPQGFVPIAGDEFVFEMTANALLLPGANGLPTWHSEQVGERAMIKLPSQFRQLMENPRPLDEKMGEALAKWAKGGAEPVGPRSEAPPAEGSRRAFRAEPARTADAPDGEPASGGFGSAPEGEPSEAVLWMRGVYEDLEGDAFGSTSDLDDFFADTANQAQFVALEMESPDLAKRLNAALTGRGKALASKAR